MNKIKFSVLLFLVLGVGFTSCKDDDDTTYVVTPSNNRGYIQTTQEMGLSGKVKTIETINYEGVWDANKQEVTKGGEKDKIILRFDNRGILETQERYRFSVDKYTLAYKRTEKFDSKYRNTLWIYEYFDNQEKQNSGQKYVTTYDDTAKKGTVINYTFDLASGEYKEDSRSIYGLNQFGFIDEGNFQDFREQQPPSTFKSTRGKLEAEGKRIIVKKDSRGNPVEQYSFQKTFNQDGTETIQYVEYYISTITYY